MADDTEEEAGRGPMSRLLASVRNLLATILAIGRTRIELLTVEVQLEIRRLAVLLILGLVVLFAAGVGVIMAGVAVIVAFWDTHRLLAAVLVAVVFLAGAAIAGLVLAVKVRNKPRMLEGTLKEFARDSERLRGGR
jgi:uncharacterized membrane protein YqjE